MVVEDLELVGGGVGGPLPGGDGQGILLGVEGQAQAEGQKRAAEPGEGHRRVVTSV